MIFIQLTVIQNEIVYINMKNIIKEKTLNCTRTLFLNISLNI